MSPELEELKTAIIAHAKLVAMRAPRIDTEAGTNTSLVQPFLRLLGYDVGNPDEVSPEHHADFSEKYQNKVDYAILHKGLPVIAVESKKIGSQMRDDRGQLRSYFNACITVKLGILTDGAKYEFFADSDKPNMMDENAFLRLDFLEIAKEGDVAEHSISGLLALKNGFFNPENVGAEAKQKLLFDSFLKILRHLKAEPTDEFIRFLLRQSEIGGKIGNLTQKIVDTNRELVRSAVEAFVAQEALARLGYEPKDVVRTPPESIATTPTTPPPIAIADVQPTPSDLQILQYIKNRIYFLINDERMFAEVEKIAFRKSKTSFRIYHNRPNSGSILDFWEQRDGKAFISFPSLGGNALPYAQNKDFDDMLFKAFSNRIKENGPHTKDSAPVLRAIQGGQAD